MPEDVTFMIAPEQAGPRRVYFVSLGCPKNQVDTEVMLGVVKGEGHVLVDDPDEADALVVNSCGFIEAAKEESIETILELGEIKNQHRAQRGRDTTLVVAGCLSQRYPTELAKEMPEVDHFLGSADMLGLAKVLGGRAARMGVTRLSQRAYLYDHTTPRQVTGTRHRAYVKIAEGCDRPCGFCVIPKLRGAQRSRDIFSVVQEVHGLVEQGTREIGLVAQDLTLYGMDLDPATDLETLLEALCKVDGLQWIRLHYAYPTAVTDGLIHRIGSEPRIASYLDVPIQHVDSDVLKRMRRGYTEARVREMVEKLRDPHYVGDARIWLRTTLLVGHPGETEPAFQRLYDFIAEGEIDHLGVFPWSREENTPSSILPARIDRALAEERAAAIMELQEGIRQRRHDALVGQSIPVMIEGESEESELLLDGRHEGQAPEIDGKVILTDGTGAPGEMVDAVVTQAGPHDLVASMDREAAVR